MFMEMFKIFIAIENIYKKKKNSNGLTSLYVLVTHQRHWIRDYHTLLWISYSWHSCSLHVSSSLGLRPRLLTPMGPIRFAQSPSSAFTLRLSQYPSRLVAALILPRFVCGELTVYLFIPHIMINNSHHK